MDGRREGGGMDGREGGMDGCLHACLRNIHMMLFKHCLGGTPRRLLRLHQVSNVGLFCMRPRVVGQLRPKTKADTLTVGMESFKQVVHTGNHATRRTIHRHP